VSLPAKGRHEGTLTPRFADRLSKEIKSNLQWVPEEKWIDYEHLKDNLGMSRSDFLNEVTTAPAPLLPHRTLTERLTD